MANFPIMQKAVVQAIGAASAGPARNALKNGWVYRLVPTVACWINFESDAAAGTGMYLPANEEVFLAFGAADSQGTNVLLTTIRAAGNGSLSITPYMRVVTF